MALDPRDRYNAELEERLANQKAKANVVGHMFMVVLLLLVVLLYLKNNLVFENDSFSYLVAFALPFTILVILAGIYVYDKFVSKLQESHRSIFIKLATLLCVFCVCLVAFVVLISLYFSNPSSMKLVAEISAGPYYISFIILSGFFVYISPGLVDKLNGIPRYQVAAFSCYLLLALILPVLYLTTVFKQSANKADAETETPSQNNQTPQEKAFAREGVYDFNKDATFIFVPVIVALVFHMSLILPQVMCRFKRKCEFLLLGCLLAIAILELCKADMKSKKTIYTQADEAVPNVWILGLAIVAWAFLYAVLF